MEICTELNTTTERIWKEFYAKLKRFIIKHVSNVDTAEDILQKVFIKIYSHLDTLREEKKLQNWIYKVTRNAIIDYYRSQKPRAKLPETLSSLQDSVNVEAKNELNQCIRNLVNNLPHKYKEALIFTEYQGLTQKEMAQNLGISLSGAKSRVQRAKRKLKNILLERCQKELSQWGIPVDYCPECICCPE